MNERIRGAWCATLTPLNERGRVDYPRFVTHVKRLFAAGIDGIAPFGTTGEGQSFSLVERRDALEALLEGGLEAHRIVPGTGCAAVQETIELTRHAIECGCAGALVLPPFFFKDIDAEGLYASYARVIDGVANDRWRLYLYHIPQVTQVPMSDELIARLVAAYPNTIAGIKDSSCDLEHEQTLLRRFPELNIFVGFEPHLPAALAAGGAGTICGLANLYPGVLRRLHDAASDAERAPALEHIERLLKLLEPYPLMPALKAAFAEINGDPGWLTVREPLVALGEDARSTLRSSLTRSGLARSAP